MIRRTTIFWAILAVAAGATMFRVKYDVIAAEERLAALHRDILARQEAIHVLEAEWAFLNDPGRLEAMAVRHLDLAAPAVTRIATFETFPFVDAPQPVAAEGPAQPRPKPLLAAVMWSSR